MENTTNLIDFLETTNKNIHNLEAEALNFLEQGNNQGHLECMKQKANLLANIYTHAKPYLKDLPKDIRRKAEARLEAFSESAVQALKIGSVFFMSALLYPDEHKPGQPNNLELLIEEIKTQIA